MLLQLTIDPEFKNLIPPLAPDEYQQLEQNILNDGCLHELIVWDGTIIDGHNRYEKCQKHSIPFKVRNWHFGSRDEAKEWIMRNQFGRRNLSDYQRSVLALRLKEIIAVRAKEKQREAGGAVIQKSDKPPIRTDKEIAKAAGVSHDTIRKGGEFRDMKWIIEKCRESYAFSVLVTVIGICLMILIAFK